VAISKKVTDRIITQLKKYQGILSGAKDRDISESDTVVIIGDMLSDVLGYKKYIEITTEFAIRGTYVDLAVKVDSNVRFLIEAKAIGVALKDNHVKQAIDYGANHGIEWVVLTNGIIWQVYKIYFRQPIDKSLIFEVDVLQTNPRNAQLLECFSNLSREGFTHSSMTAFFQQRQATSKFSIAAMLTSEPMLHALRKEVRRISTNVKVEEDFLKGVLQNEVLKRELVEGEEAKQAADFVKKALKSAAKPKQKPEPKTSPQSSTPQSEGGQ
jgi:hypothetical protein